MKSVSYTVFIILFYVQAVAMAEQVSRIYLVEGEKIVDKTFDIESQQASFIEKPFVHVIGYVKNSGIYYFEKPVELELITKLAGTYESNSWISRPQVIVIKGGNSYLVDLQNRSSNRNPTIMLDGGEIVYRKAFANAKLTSPANSEADASN